MRLLFVLALASVVAVVGGFSVSEAMRHEHLRVCYDSVTKNIYVSAIVADCGKMFMKMYLKAQNATNDCVDTLNEAMTMLKAERRLTDELTLNITSRSRSTRSGH